MLQFSRLPDYHLYFQQPPALGPTTSTTAGPTFPVSATAAPPRIFLSYARSDRDFAVALRDEMIAAGLAVWHDLKNLEGGQWWSQITGASGRSE